MKNERIEIDHIIIEKGAFDMDEIDKETALEFAMSLYNDALTMKCDCGVPTNIKMVKRVVFYKWRPHIVYKDKCVNCKKIIEYIIK